MRMEHLHYLLEISDNRSIAAAAKKLYLGHTTLSAITKKCEQDLGITLFQRQHKGVDVTPEGEEAISLISEIWSLYEEVLALDPASAEENHPVSVLLAPTINSGLAVPLTQKFYQQAPDGQLDIRAATGRDISGMLIKNEANIGITLMSKSQAEDYRAIAAKYQLSLELIRADYHYLVVSKDHPLAHLDSISAEDVKNLNFALLPHYLVPYYQAVFGEGNQYTTMGNIALIKQAIVRQNMASILGGFAVYQNKSTVNDQLKPIRLLNYKKESFISTYLIYREEKNLNSKEKILLQCIRECFADNPPLLA